MTWVWIKIKPPEKPQVVVEVSVYQGSILGTFDPQPHETSKMKEHITARGCSPAARWVKHGLDENGRSLLMSHVCVDPWDQ